MPPRARYRAALAGETYCACAISAQERTTRLRPVDCRFSWRKISPQHAVKKRNVCLASLPLTGTPYANSFARAEHDYAADAGGTAQPEQIYFTRAALPRRPINWSMNEVIDPLHTHLTRLVAAAYTDTTNDTRMILHTPCLTGRSAGVPSRQRNYSVTYRLAAV